MSVQYDKSIPVFDNHCHICFPQKIDDSLRDYEVLFRRLSINRAGLLSCPCSGHNDVGIDILENLKILYLKDRLSVPCFTYAGFTWHWDDSERYVQFGREMLEIGFDGFKTLEQHPRVRRMIGKSLADSSMEGFFEFANSRRSVMVCHVGDPRNNWDLSSATPEAMRLGRVYAGDYLSLDELYEEMLAVISRCPDMRFILAHFFFMSDNYDRVCRLMDDFPNIYLDLTPGGEMYVNFTKDTELWRDFFSSYSDRIILGSDNYALGYGEARYDMARNFLEGTELHALLRGDLRRQVGIVHHEVHIKAAEQVLHAGADRAVADEAQRGRRADPGGQPGEEYRPGHDRQRDQRDQDDALELTGLSVAQLLFQHVPPPSGPPR